MKLIIPTVCLLAAAACAEVLLEQDFDSLWTTNDPPGGWRIYHTNSQVEGDDDWHRQATASVPWPSHSSPYAAIFWELYPDAPPDSYMSPLIDCSGWDRVTLICSTLFLRKMPISYTAQLRYSIDGGQTYPYLLRDYYEQSFEGEERFELDQATNQSAVVLIWVFDGDLANINWWCFDDVRVEADSMQNWDIVIHRIITPRPIEWVGPMTPRIRVRNEGLLPRTNIPVRADLSDSTRQLLYSWAETIPSLNPDEVATVSFLPPYEFTEPGNDFLMEFWIVEDTWARMDGDTARVEFDVVATSRDVGVIEIVVPADSVDSAAYVTPVVLIENFGNVSADSVLCRFRIGEWSVSKLARTLPAGGQQFVTFDERWRAVEPGVHTAFAWTEWPPDSMPENDTTSKSFVVKGVGGVAEEPVEVIQAARQATVMCSAGLVEFGGQVFDVHGREVTDLKALRPGVYFLRREDSRETRKVILTR